MVDPLSYFLGVKISTFIYGRFNFNQNGFFWEFLGDTGIEHCNGSPTPTKV